MGTKGHAPAQRNNTVAGAPPGFYKTNSKPTVKDETLIKLKLRVVQVLERAKIPNPVAYANSLSYYTQKTIDHFANACNRVQLPYDWAPPQLEAFFLHLDDLYMTKATLKMHWQVIQEISTKLQVPLTQQQITLFDFVLANCKSKLDNKLPVNRELLIELMAACDLLLLHYDAVLMKSILLCAFGGFMRCCEYTEPRRNRKNHNVHADAVTVTNLGLGISFWSDKTNQDDPTCKHRFVFWEFLPAGAKEILEEYVKIKPFANHFFVREDGTQVTRTHFENFFHACSLHTRWRHLVLMPHCLRIGGASSARAAGAHILDLKHAGRWKFGGNTIDHYLRVPFISMEPEKIWERKEFRKEWTPKQLGYLARNVVQTPGGSDHPHNKMLVKHFEKQLREGSVNLPHKYPARGTVFQLKRRAKARKEGTYIKISQTVKLLQEQNIKVRKAISKIVRKAAHNYKVPETDVERLRLQLQSLQPFQEKAVQTEEKLNTSTACQTDSITILEGENMQEEKSSKQLSQEPRKMDGRKPSVEKFYTHTVENATTDGQRWEENSDSFKKFSEDPTLWSQEDEAVDIEVQQGEEQEPIVHKVTVQVVEFSSDDEVHLPQLSEEEKNNKSEVQVAAQVVDQHSPELTVPSNVEKERAEQQQASPLSWPTFRKAMTQGFGAPSVAVPQAPGARKSLFRNKKATHQLCKAYIDGQTQLLSREEWKEKFPEAKASRTVTAGDNENITRGLRYRLSRRWREYSCLKEKYKYRKKNELPIDFVVPERPYYSTTMRALVNHYLDAVILGGDDCYPGQVTEMDPEDSDDEFCKRVLERFPSKAEFSMEKSVTAERKPPQGKPKKRRSKVKKSQNKRKRTESASEDSDDPEWHP